MHKISASVPAGQPAVVLIKQMKGGEKNVLLPKLRASQTQKNEKRKMLSRAITYISNFPKRKKPRKTIAESLYSSGKNWFSSGFLTIDGFENHEKTMKKPRIARKPPKKQFLPEEYKLSAIIMKSSQTLFSTVVGVVKYDAVLGVKKFIYFLQVQTYRLLYVIKITYEVWISFYICLFNDNISAQMVNLRRSISHILASILIS